MDAFGLEHIAVSVEMGDVYWPELTRACVLIYPSCLNRNGERGSDGTLDICDGSACGAVYHRVRKEREKAGERV